ncbi:MAG: cytochrome c3 family protein [Acidobacteria bacterium]|nr:cytochrome c3 family protein [Acidobacteriota bacterium]
MKLRWMAPIFVMALGLPAQTAKNSCVECHAALEGDLARPAELFANDIHGKNGFSCVACHGGDPSSDDPEVAMSRGRGFLGKIDRRSVPARCARCHSDANLIHRFKPQQRVDQLAQYQTSVHGQRLAAGDVKVANCIDCHSVHDIREVSDPLSPVYPLRLPETCARCHADAAHMQGYRIPTDQFEKYRKSVHWEALAQRGDLSAPNCATCHGNHGAAPPGVASVAMVCGSCHVVFENLFVKSPHKKAFDNMGLAGCVVCHSNHDVEKPTLALVGVQPGAVCLNCHAKGDKGYEAAMQMRSRLEQLAASLGRSDDILKMAESSGMEVSEARLGLGTANESLVKAEVDLHSFDPAMVDGAVAKGLEVAQSSYRAGQKALEERDYRRKGLALSLVTIVVTMAGLWLAVRELDNRRKKSS